MYDIIIIGSGPGGFELALAAKKENLKVALIEKGLIGGTCLNCGCIPTKTLRHEAALLDELQKISSFSDYKFSYAETQKRKEEVLNNLRTNLQKSLERAKVDLFFGLGEIVDKNTVTVNGQTLTGKNLVIATGSKPRRIPLYENNKYCLTPEQLLDIKDVPKHLVIVGGGVIGLEMACLFHTFGSEITIIETLPNILNRADREIVKRLHLLLVKRGMRIITSASIEDCKDNIITVNGENIKADAILVAVGREANVSGFGLEKLNLEYTQRGFIAVDDNFQASIPNVYVIGDANGKLMLAHYATYNSYRVLNTILEKKDEIDFNNIPSCVFTIPEFSIVGKTEEECEGMDYQVYKAFYRNNGKALASVAGEGIVKIIVSNEQIIGAHLLGKDSNVLIHEILVIMNAKIPYSKVKDYIHAHPSLSEVLADLFR